MRPLLRRWLRAWQHRGEEARQWRANAPYLMQSLGWPGERRPEPLLIGYFEIGFGLGEYARGLALALERAGHPFAAYPYRAYTDRSAPIRDWTSRYDVWRAHDINIFCMAVDQTEPAIRILGRRRFAGAYNILATFWELAEAPAAWQPALAAFDEVWTPNAYVAGAIRPLFPGPITILAPCVDLGAVPSPDRARHGLDADRFWFLFSFDFNSRPERKNPLGLLRAFADAFPHGTEPVGLVIKSNGERGHYPDVASALDAAVARDPARIRLVHAEMSRELVLSLMASVDGYVSLHRAEGFGLGMAEAMLLGIPVIGTAYSGNADFLRADTGYPVPYSLVPIAPGAYPHGDGLHWAEPDHDAAVAALRQVVGDADERGRRVARGRQEIAGRYGPVVVGSAAASRLEAIRASRHREET